MKITFKTTTHRLLSVLLCGALLWAGFSVQPSFLGPGLSAAAAEMVATQPIANDEVVFPPNNFANVTAASTTYYNNIVVSFRINVEDVASLAFFVQDNDSEVPANDSQVALSFYSTKYNEHVVVQDINDGKLFVGYDPYGEDYIETEILRCAYYSADTVANAKNAITYYVDSGQYVDGDYIMHNENTAVLVTKVLLGDVDGNGSLSMTDSLQLQQIINGTRTPTYEQRLACDVNFDDFIDSEDVALINDYCNNMINTFVPINSVVPITTPTTAPVNNDLIYRIKHTSSMDYLFHSAVSATPQIGAYEPGNTARSTNFIINYGSSGLCTVKSCLDNKYLTLNSNGTVSFLTSQGSLNQFWYLVPAVNGYYLVSYNRPQYLFDGSNFLSRDIDKSVWQFEEMQIMLRYHYNYGYRYRFWNNLSASDKVTYKLNGSQLDAQIKSELNTHQEEIADIITTLFDVRVVPQRTGLLLSWEDTCYAPNTNPTHAQMVAAIGENEIMDETADGNHDDGDVCNCVSWQQCFNSQSELFHHRSASKGLDVYADKKTNITEHQVWLLTSGYEPCFNVDIDKDGDVDEHKYSAIAGLAAPWNLVAGVYHSSSSDNTNGIISAVRTKKNTLTALHEISHILGAVESATCQADNPHNLYDENGQPVEEGGNGLGRCVMSYNRDESFLINAYNEPDNYRQLYCDGCYNAMEDYLKYY
ncbi:MAG: hypothetical protein IJP35_06440 [Clostridia bacterium]|nr:hypothetical protein [Clostridia bacterium]